MKCERWLFVLALALGAMLRLPQLGLRPMHTDEAVHAVKFGTLLETGTYRYDRNEYHGPTLNYLTLLPAWCTSETSIVQVTETTLRIVPALFGFGMVLLILPLRDIGARPLAIGALLTACSPAMVFYSRYYIQETLLVFFALGLIGAGYRFLQGGGIFWSLMAGMFAGLMFATKETWLISCGAMSAALVAVLFLSRHRKGCGFATYVRGIGLAFLSGAVVSVLFYSSFFTHWQGVQDSLLSYQTYVLRAGEDTRHGHPWYYFLEMLMFRQGDHGPLWSEAAIVLFGALGIAGSFSGRKTEVGGGKDLKLFLGVYACLMLFILSAIPYKTPWLVLGALQPLILMAGYGVSLFLGSLHGGARIAGIVVALLLVSHLVWQAYQANFVFYDDPVNPYAYSQPTNDVKLIATALDDLLRHSPEEPAIQVVAPGDDYWPLPWYLRGIARVGWWNHLGKDFVATPVILATPDVQQSLLWKLYEVPPPGQRPLYVPLFDRPMYLRPGKEIRGYVRLDLKEEATRSALDD